MEQPIQFTIDSLNVMTLPLKPRLCLRLDKKVTSLVVDTLGGKDKLDLTDFENIEVSSILKNFTEALSNLEDDDYINLIVALLSNTQIEKDKVVTQISDGESFDKAFIGSHNITIYKILLKIMEINKFSPFVLAEEMGYTDLINGLTGDQTNTISS